MNLGSCTSSKFPGYEQADSGTYYKILSEGPKKQKVNEGDVIFIRQMMLNEKDSVIYDYKTMSQPGEPYAVRIDKSSYPGDMFEILMKMHVGDSISLAMRVDSLFNNYYKQEPPKYLNKNSYLIYYLKIDSMYTRSQIDSIEKVRRMAFEKQVEEAKNSEESLIKNYIAEKKITVKPTASGIYIQILEKGKGKKVEKGDNIEVNYKGMFLDGRVFDASDRHDEAFVFAAGTGMVIPGWDEALLSMTAGTRALVVIPSNMAYGEMGSSPVIPPYSPLAFELEVVGIKSDSKK